MYWTLREREKKKNLIRFQLLENNNNNNNNINRGKISIILDFETMTLRWISLLESLSCSFSFLIANTQGSHLNESSQINDVANKRHEKKKQKRKKIS